MPLESLRAKEVGEFAGKIFDYHTANTSLVRLLHWEGLAYDGEVPDEAARAVYYQRKVDVFRATQRHGVLIDEPDAAHLVFLLLSLAAWWFAVPQVARMLTGATDGDENERARQRASVVQAARNLALPRSTRPYKIYL